METPALQIHRVISDLEKSVDGLDAKAKVAVLGQAVEAATLLRHAIAQQRGEAVRALVEEIGATAAAKELDVSRNRVYELMRGPEARRS